MCQEKLDKYSQVLSLSVCEQECEWELEREEMNVGIFFLLLLKPDIILSVPGHQSQAQQEV